MVKVATIGDVNMDIASKVNSIFADIKTDVFEHAPVRYRIGGTAGGFAHEAKDKFDSVHVYGKVGNDAIGRVIKESLAAEGISEHLALDDKLPTRIVMSLREKTSTDGRRIMLSGADTAQSNLQPTDITHFLERVHEYDLLVLDAFGLLNSTLRATTESAMAAAVAAGVPVAFDIVPHNIRDFLSYDDIAPSLKQASFIITNIHTLESLINPTDQHADDTHQAAVKLIGDARQKLPSDATFMVNYGVGNISELTIGTGSEHDLHKMTGFQKVVDPTGFGDRIAAQELRDWIRRAGRLDEKNT